MRHYYRFMELEPVMEQEEDSVGEASPTSSMGSPSFSPPPDAWAQLSGKEYHDTLSNHLLQEHMDLQRAYRLLEVQLRNCDTRASRDLQRLKEALPNQDRLREELQRAKERETVLRGEIYDLQEQNELLEFRILELEECHENASVRSGNPGSRDVGTEMESADVSESGHTSLPVNDENQRVQARLADTPASPPHATPSDRHQQQTQDAEDITLIPHLSGSAHPQAGPKQCTQQEQLQISQREDSHEAAEDLQSEATGPNHVDQATCNEFSSNTHTSLSEGISCTLCRRLPRRRSFHGPSQLPLHDGKEGENQRDPLRKSKSDGEIKARHGSHQSCELFEIDQHHSPVRKQEVHLEESCAKKGVEELTKKFEGLAEAKKLEFTSIGTGNHVTVKDEGVQVDVVRHHFSGTRVEEQVKTMRSMLNAIYDVLRETRVEVECTNSELREEVETLETTVQRLTLEVARRAGGSCEGVTKPPPVRRSRSLSFSKDCYCCSQELRPTLEEVISKLQQVMDLVVDTATNATNELNELEVATTEAIEVSEESEAAGVATLPSVEDVQTIREINECVSKELRTNDRVLTDRRVEELGVMEGFGEKEDEGKLETKTKEKVNPISPVSDQMVMNEARPIQQAFNDHMRSKLYLEEGRPVSGMDEYNFVGSCYGSQATLNAPETRIAEVKGNTDKPLPPPRRVAAANYYPDPSEGFREQVGYLEQGAEEATNQIEPDPLPEEQTKPVLRRWREQLLVRRDRVQPWRIEMLDFPKRLPSVV